MINKQNLIKFNHDIKQREIESLDYHILKNGKINFNILLGDYKVKQSQFDKLMDAINQINSKVDQGFKEVNSRLNALTVAVKELQSEATNHG